MPRYALCRPQDISRFQNWIGMIGVMFLAASLVVILHNFWLARALYARVHRTKQTKHQAVTANGT